LSVHFLSLTTPPSLVVCLSLLLPFLFLYLYLSLPLSFSFFLFYSVFFVAYRQSLFHFLRVFEFFNNALWKRGTKRHLYLTDIVLNDRTFVCSFSFSSPFRSSSFFFFFFININHCAKQLDVSSACFRVLMMITRRFPLSHLSHFSYLISLFLSLSLSLSLSFTLSWILMRNLRRIERIRRISLH